MSSSQSPKPESPEYHVSPWPFSPDEDEALVRSWIMYAYDKDEYGKSYPNDNIYQVQMRGFAKVLEYFENSFVNRYHRDAEELYERFHEISAGVDEFINIMEELRMGPGSYVHSVLHNAQHQWFAIKKEVFPFLGCYEMLSNYPDRHMYYTGIKRNFRLKK